MASWSLWTVPNLSTTRPAIRSILFTNLTSAFNSNKPTTHWEFANWNLENSKFALDVNSDSESRTYTCWKKCSSTYFHTKFFFFFLVTSFTLKLISVFLFLNLSVQIQISKATHPSPTYGKLVGAPRDDIQEKLVQLTLVKNL